MPIRGPFFLVWVFLLRR